MPRNNVNPPCPVCGSSATLPFENEETSLPEQTFSEIILTAFLFFLVPLSFFLLLLLSRAGFPLVLLMLLVVFLLWRRKEENRHARQRPQQFVCLDCSRNFKA